MIIEQVVLDDISRTMYSYFNYIKNGFDINY